MKIHVLKIKLRKLHKYIGFTFSLFIVHLTITGILLLYPTELRIKDIYISNYYILKKYNMETYKDVYKSTNDENVISIKNNIYINKNFVDKIKYDILGIKYDNRLNKLYILDENFINIYDFEKIDEDLEISNITVIENKLNFTNLGYDKYSKNIVLKSDKAIYTLSDSDITDYKNNNEKLLVWPEIATASKDTANKYLIIHQGEGVSLTRIITELHNGKFFGSPFTFLLFLASLSLIFLTLSSFVFATNFFNKRR